MCVLFSSLNVGCRGVRGGVHRHREERLLCEGVCPKTCSGKQVEVGCHGGDAQATVCLHVRAGQGAEGVAGRPQTGPVQTHVSTAPVSKARKY